jgi:3'-phosphoadenosine 5'-phosphosulfate sulfotransferase (PAPS reductase)/FAD synthetase
MSTILHFSGGKDSIACLHLLEHRWDEIIVCWVNTGAAFPETVEYMDGIRQLVPHFHEVNSAQTIEQDGYPVDVMPVSRSTFGQIMEPNGMPRFQSRYVCCGSALWVPMGRAMKELNATVVIRGQKNSDRLKSSIQNGQTCDGIEYQFPLQDWTDADVYRYLREKKVVLPANYAYMNTGLDCWNCTAYLAENAGKLDYIRENHPIKHRHIVGKLQELAQALHNDEQPLRDILESQVTL